METEKTKVEKILADLEASPMARQIREEKAADTLAKRREVRGRIDALKNEEGVVLPKLQADLEEIEAKHRAAKLAQESAAEEVREAAATLRRARLDFGTTIGNCEAALLESADPAIDAAIKFFRDKLDFLRKPGRLSRNAIGSERNLISWKKKTFEESNEEAVRAALQYCQAAITTLESWKLLPAVDASKIEEMKKGIPQIDVYTAYTGERSMEKVVTDPRMLLPSDSQTEWEIGKLLEKVKKLMATPTPVPAKKREAATIPAPAPKPAKQATLETYSRQHRAGFIGGAFDYGNGSKR